MEVLTTCLERVTSQRDKTEYTSDEEIIIGEILGGMVLLTLYYRKPLRMKSLRRALPAELANRKVTDRLKVFSKEHELRFSSLGYIRDALTSMSYRSIFVEHILLY